MRRLPLLGFLAVACSANGHVDEPTKAASTAIVAGKPSGDDENANVFIVTQTDTDAALRCSGRIIAPGLVVGARHCFLTRRSVDVKCKPDGTPADINDVTGLKTEPASAITVYIGSSKANQQAIGVRELIVNNDITVCRGDIAYLVLVEPGLDQRTPIRRTPPSLGETIAVSGWGFVNDTDRTELPDTRSTTTAKVLDYGPPALPTGVFTVPGNTLCLGDSGAGALIDGKLVGTYSRIDDATTCTSEFGRNFLTAVVSDPELLNRAYAAIGEKPWFDGEEKPWLAKAGAPCTADTECAGGVCETGACRSGCGPTGVACAVGQTCSADGTCVANDVPDAAASVDDAGVSNNPSPTDGGGCSVGHGRTSRDGGMAFALLAIAALARRRRATSR